LPPSGDRSNAVMVMVIVELLGEHHRLRGWQVVKANSPRLKTIPLMTWHCWRVIARLARASVQCTIFLCLCLWLCIAGHCLGDSFGILRRSVSTTERLVRILRRHRARDFAAAGWPVRIRIGEGSDATKGGWHGWKVSLQICLRPTVRFEPVKN
jgi:hypothetical protein